VSRVSTRVSRTVSVPAIGELENRLCPRHRGTRELINISLITKTEMVLTALIHSPFNHMKRLLADKILLHACIVQASDYIYRVSQEECARLRDGVPYVKVYRYDPKHLYPKLNGYGDNGQRKVGASCGSKYCNLHS